MAKNPKKAAEKTESELPANIHVKVLRDTPQVEINSLSSRYYKKGWTGPIPAEIASQWKDEGYVEFTADASDNNPLPVESDENANTSPSGSNDPNATENGGAQNPA